MKTHTPSAGGIQPAGPGSAEAAAQALQHACELQRNGLYAEAEGEYERLLAAFPDASPLHYNLGLMLYAQQRYGESLEHYLQAMDGAGDDPDLLYNLGLCLKKCGRTADSAMVYEEMLRLAPRDVDGLYSLAGCLRELHDYQRAEAVLGRLLALKPDHRPAAGSLAYLLHLQGRLAESCAAYLRLLELDPENRTARHMVAALRGDRLATAADDYVRSVFNGYADGFEASLVQDLGYRVPAELRRGVDLFAGRGRRYAHLLDLGCGTGLVGTAFADICACLTGVDIAEEMIARSREKGIYDHLAVSGIMPFLVAAESRYDLVTLADVLIYLGDPEPVLAAIQAVTTDDAVLCFSIEVAGTATYRLQPTGRFAHSPGHIAGIAGRTGWTVCRSEPIRLRREGDGWIGGMLFFLLKAGSGQPVMGPLP
ncbi:MAG: tetratricopeptide repeat protein [Desulfobulbaceae bacterium]|nr:MAG: tetratricopeptide repeat protein [Desulfobulbaceae bacterium]